MQLSLFLEVRKLMKLQGVAYLEGCIEVLRQYLRDSFCLFSGGTTAHGSQSSCNTDASSPSLLLQSWRRVSHLFQSACIITSPSYNYMNYNYNMHWYVTILITWSCVNSWSTVITSSTQYAWVAMANFSFDYIRCHQLDVRMYIDIYAI